MSGVFLLGPINIAGHDLHTLNNGSGGILKLKERVDESGVLQPVIGQDPNTLTSTWALEECNEKTISGPEEYIRLVKQGRIVVFNPDGKMSDIYCNALKENDSLRQMIHPKYFLFRDNKKAFRFKATSATSITAEFLEVSKQKYYQYASLFERRAYKAGAEAEHKEQAAAPRTPEPVVRPALAPASIKPLVGNVTPPTGSPNHSPSASPAGTPPGSPNHSPSLSATTPSVTPSPIVSANNSPSGSPGGTPTGSSKKDKLKEEKCTVM